MLRSLGSIEVAFAPEGGAGGSATSSSAAPDSSRTSAPAGAGSAPSAPSSPSGASSPTAPSSAAGAPPATPSSGTPSEPAGSGGGSEPDNPWSFDNFDDPDDTPHIDVSAKAPTDAPTSEQPTPPTAAQTTPQPAAPVQTDGAQAAPTPQPSPGEASPPSLPTDPVALSQLLRQSSSEIEQGVADSLFKLTPEDIEALDANAGAHVPKLLARVYIQSQAQMMDYLGRNLPRMIQQTVKMLQKNRENEDSFYSAFPAIQKSPATEQLVRETAYLYRQMNPQATKEKLIADIGPIILLKLGLPISPQRPASTNGVAPSTRLPQPSPFVPAVPGHAGAPPQPGPHNPWEVDPSRMDED